MSEQPLESDYDPHADPQWSEDGHWWWDGEKWITAAERDAELSDPKLFRAAEARAARAKAKQREADRVAQEQVAREKAAEAARAKAERLARQRAEAAAQREAERVAAAEAEAAQARAAQEQAEESARLQAATAALAAERRAEAARAKADAAAAKRAEAAAKRDAAKEEPAPDTSWAPAAAPQADTTRPERSGLGTRTRVVLALLLVGVIAAGVVLALVNKSSTPKTPAGPGGTAGSTLLDAAKAEQQFHDKHATYTGSILDLMPLGFRPAKGVTLTVLRADAGTYCLSGAKGGVTYYLSSADPTVSQTPCS